jgi:hypothetical protein
VISRPAGVPMPGRVGGANCNHGKSFSDLAALRPL